MKNEDQADLSRTLTILVPAPSPAGAAAAADIADRSAILADAARWNDLKNGGKAARIYYEGGIHEGMNKPSFRAKLERAASRLLTQYPTVAASSVSNPDEWVEVGSMTYSPWRLTVTDFEALNAHGITAAEVADAEPDLRELRMR